MNGLSFQHLILSEACVCQSNIKKILQAYYSATQSDPKWYKAWHTWSLANFEVVGYLESQNLTHPDGVLAHNVVTYVTSAVQGNTYLFYASFLSLTARRLLPINRVA